MSKYTTEIRYICESNAPVTVYRRTTYYIANQTYYVKEGTEYVVADPQPTIRTDFDENIYYIKVTYTQSVGYDDIDRVIESGRNYIFDFDYPIFDENYKSVLETKIIKHYYTREISEESVGLWKLRLNDKMNIIMPYYNKLYESELLEFNPLYDVDLTRTQIRENEGNEITSRSDRENVEGDNVRARTETNERTNESATENISAQNSENNSDGSSSGTRWDLYSDTPQGGVVGIDNATTSVGSNAYLTNARKLTDEEEHEEHATGAAESVSSGTANESTSANNEANEIGNYTSERTGSSDGVRALSSMEDYIEHITGKQGTMSYSKMLEEFRKTFLNIDKMVINELSDLFFGLW